MPGGSRRRGGGGSRHHAASSPSRCPSGDGGDGGDGGDSGGDGCAPPLLLGCSRSSCSAAAIHAAMAISHARCGQPAVSLAIGPSVTRPRRVNSREWIYCFGHGANTVERGICIFRRVAIASAGSSLQTPLRCPRLRHSLAQELASHAAADEQRPVQIFLPDALRAPRGRTGCVVGCCCSRRACRPGWLAAPPKPCPVLFAAIRATCHGRS
jgi:hypothetical protein